MIVKMFYTLSNSAVTTFSSRTYNHSAVFRELNVFKDHEQKDMLVKMIQHGYPFLFKISVSKQRLRATDCNNKDSAVTIKT